MNGKAFFIILLGAGMCLGANAGNTLIPTISEHGETGNTVIPTTSEHGEEGNTLIPKPSEYRELVGGFEFNENINVFLHSDGAQTADLTEYLSQLPFKVQFVSQKDEAAVKILIDSGAGIAEEGYRMKVEPNGVEIVSGSASGAFYAVQNILQMTRWGETGRIPCCEIVDAPRFPYRGLHVDVSRHFRSKEFIMKQMDAMALFKLNKIHLHLTDAAGWRIEIDGWPLLTELAAWRPQRSWSDWTAAGDPYCTRDEPGAYGGYFTKDDIRQILAHAALRHIEVIPEIEMPGHSAEVMAAYPGLGCGIPDDSQETGGNAERRLSDLCPGKEATFEFIEDVLGQIIDLFPSRYIHIGGDEAEKTAWTTCPDCLRRMREEGLETVDQLQSYLIHRVEEFVNSRGRQIIGWDEILQGGLAPNATVMSWRGMDGGIRAAKMGHDVIMAPTTHCYLDYYQDAPFKEPAAFGGYIPLAKTYSFEPVPEELAEAGHEGTEVNSSDSGETTVADGAAGETEETGNEFAEHILGVQGNLWAEMITEDSHAEYMYYPRALAIAEVGWSPAGGKDYDGFRLRALTALKTLHRMGFTTFDLASEYGGRPESRAPLTHLASGCAVTYLTPYSDYYKAGGDGALTDGLRGDWTHVGGCWQGFNGDMEVIVDLGEPREVHSVEAAFMNAAGAWIHIPKSMEVSVSVDGVNFEAAGTAVSAADWNRADTFFEPFTVTLSSTARYVRVKAGVNDRRGAWVFTDEIIVR